MINKMALSGNGRCFFVVVAWVLKKTVLGRKLYMIRKGKKQAGAVMRRAFQKTVRGNRGMTLMELMTVMAIIAVIGMITIPGVISWVPKYRLKSAALAFFSDVQTARMRAVQDKQAYAIVCNDTAGTYQLIAGGVGGTVEKTVTLSDFGSGVSFGTGDATVNPSGGGLPSDGISYVSGTDDNTIVFNTRGMVTSTGDVYLQNNRQASYVIGTPTIAGAIRLRRWAGASWE